jgi:subtilisin family serine protease
MDDHSHGTHLAGIISKTIRENQPAINYQLMALKVMDANGVGNTFDAVCSILYAAEKGAKVINASWGFYGGSEKLLKRAIRYAASKGAVFVNAAGNESADLARTDYYPAEYALTGSTSIRSLMFVGALNQNGDLWPETNIRTRGIIQDGFVATPGENIRSLIPFHLRRKVPATKSGTSMATPVMSAIMANYINTFPNQDPPTVRSNVLDKILTTIPAKTFTVNGQAFPYYPVEWLNF